MQHYKAAVTPDLQCPSSLGDLNVGIPEPFVESSDLAAQEVRSTTVLIFNGLGLIAGVLARLEDEHFRFIEPSERIHAETSDRQKFGDPFCWKDERGGFRFV
ncbi:hypothetical protein TM102_06980 [Bradyrhizobium sp. TM102]|nr:hypothetical protein TM102_06980 [Bradyrhizobium sp. TM102]